MNKTPNDEGSLPSPRIEFFGGPYDGHKEAGLERQKRLPPKVAWLVCEAAFRLLDGKDDIPGGNFTSVAIYQLESDSAPCRYQFERAISFEEFSRSVRKRGVN